MKLAMSFAAGSLTLLLAACTAGQAPVAPEVPAPPEPASTPPAPASTSLPMAKRAAGQENADPMQIFRAFGTEPFWNVNAEDATLTFTTPEDQDGVVMSGQRRSLEDGVEITGSHAGMSFTLRVHAGMCSDGMSDNQYELVSSFRYGETEYTGCGEVAK